MRIGIDGRLWGETGVGRYIRNLVKELQVLDQKNDYVLFVKKADYDKVKFQISNFKFQIRIADIRWHTIDEQLKFPQILNKENLDLMHFPYFSVPVRYKRPYVITIHDLILNHFPTGKASTLPTYLYQLKRLGYNYVISKAVNNAKKIIVPLNAVKDDLVKTMKVADDKIVVTYEGVDESVKGKGERGKKEPNNPSPFTLHPSPYFLYVGNAYPHKNIDRMIEAFSIFRKENKDINLILVGKDDYFYKKLQEKIIKENLSGIVIKNNVDDHELAQLYKNAIALIAPSLMEGFGLPVLEALSSKCLVLASDIDSFREVAQGAAIYFDQYSIGDMKEKMKYLSELDKLAREELTKRGHDRSKQFSWKRMAKQTLSVYEEVANSA